MSHNLFGERYAGRRAGWHVLGDLLTEGEDAVEAVRKCRLNYRLFTTPLLVDLNGVQTSYGKVAIVREPTDDDPQYRVLGEASDGYTLLQNEEIAAMVNPLTERWPVETVGALGVGETIFLTLKAGHYDVAGIDPIERFFAVTDTRDGGTAMTVFFTGIRIVCQNTLIAGKEASVASSLLNHTQSIGQELEWRLGLVKDMQAVQDKMCDAFDLMAISVLSTEATQNIIAQAYPYRRKPRKLEMVEGISPEELGRLFGLTESVNMAEREWQAAKDRANERRVAAQSLALKFNDEQPQMANTAWAAYNAVVEVEDYREAVGKENADEALMFGERARTKQRAFSAALEYTHGRR